MGFGSRLKSVLIEIDMKVSDLAKNTSIPASTLYSIISKDIDNVGLERVAKIEKAVHAKPGTPIYRMLHNEQVNIETYKLNTDNRLIGGEDKEFWLMDAYKKLNATGQCKVTEYAEDLTKIPEYRKETE